MNHKISHKSNQRTILDYVVLCLLLWYSALMCFICFAVHWRGKVIFYEPNALLATFEFILSLLVFGFVVYRLQSWIRDRRSYGRPSRNDKNACSTNSHGAV